MIIVLKDFSSIAVHGTGVEVGMGRAVQRCWCQGPKINEAKLTAITAKFVSFYSKRQVKKQKHSSGCYCVDLKKELSPKTLISLIFSTLLFIGRLKLNSIFVE